MSTNPWRKTVPRNSAQHGSRSVTLVFYSERIEPMNSFSFVTSQEMVRKIKSYVGNSFRRRSASSPTPTIPNIHAIWQVIFIEELFTETLHFKVWGTPTCQLLLSVNKSRTWESRFWESGKPCSQRTLKLGKKSKKHSTRTCSMVW